MKSTRQNIILQIISEQEIETQNQLMDVLAQHGVSSTQATLSRAGNIATPRRLRMNFPAMMSA